METSQLITTLGRDGAQSRTSIYTNPEATLETELTHRLASISTTTMNTRQ
jgi:hypothetical protein